MMEHSPLITRGYSHGSLVCTRGYGYSWAHIKREVIRFCSQLGVFVSSCGVLSSKLTSSLYRVVVLQRELVGKSEIDE